LLSLLDPKILLSTLFPKTLNLFSYLSVGEQVLHQYKTTGSIIDVYILIFELWAGKIRVQFLTKTGIFSFCHHVQRCSGTHPASYQMDTGGSSLGVKWLECEADHSPLPRAKVKNMWS